MDHHNLEDSLNIECMDFDHSEDVVNQEDIPLEDDGRLDSITMGLENVNHSHSLLDSVHDEVIVSDLIEDPFPFQEYCMQSDGASGIMVDPNQLTRRQHEPLETQVKVPVAPTSSSVVTLKVPPPRVTKRITSAAPRQVAIAPKPMPSKTIQYAIAPKTVTIMPSKQTIKKVPMSVDAGMKGGVLAHIGRHVVMVPKKIKLMNSTSVEGVIKSSGTGIQYQMVDQAQVATNTSKGSTKPMKFIQIQGQGSAESNSCIPVVTKILPKGGRYLMQQKTVPISIGANKVPVVQNLKLAGKNQIVAIKQQNAKVVATSQGNITTKRVVISNSKPKVIFRPTALTSTTQVVKDTVSTGQRTQFHPINVPGKGVQYIKLVTNQTAQKAAPKPATVPAKNFFMTDSKGNIIQMTAEKVSADGQSSVVIPRTVTGNKVLGKTLKTQKRLVRIAPVSKAVTQTISQTVRSQSLLAPTPASSTAMPMPSLAPLSNVNETAAVTLEEFNNMVERSNSLKSTSDKRHQSFKLSNYINASYFPLDINNSTVEEYLTANESLTEEVSEVHNETVAEETFDSDEPADVKPILQSIISNAVTSSLATQNDHGMDDVHEEIEYEDVKHTVVENASFMLQDDIHMEQDSITHDRDIQDESNVIIVPATNYAERHESMYSDDSQSYRRLSVESKNIPMLSVEAECVPYSEHNIMPASPQPDSEPDQSVANLDMRPRKACNCTKSQCLKLYCDCFANGEFCNNCNCTNCYNNLENEEVRQKAIRSCLERNPNAFRPKIGKSKVGGPEIIRRHTKGCNCKRSGCLKNYCECYEAKIACTTMCKCVGCRNVEETLVRRRDAIRLREKLKDQSYRPTQARPTKQPCSFMTNEVIEAVCQCLVAAGGESDEQRDDADPVRDVIEEFARCLQDVISASHHSL